MLIWPLRMLGMIVAQAQRAAASAERVHEVLVDRARSSTTAAPPAAAARRPARRARSRFEGVHLRLRHGPPPVLDGFDLAIARRASPSPSSAPTGSGKTTVARLIPRFYDVDGGAVAHRRRRRPPARACTTCAGAVGIVFEDTFLFTDTDRAPTSPSPTPTPRTTTIERAARLAGAHEFIADLPDGLRHA